MKKIDLKTFFMFFYSFVVVSHRVFMKKQPFLDFLCEIMRHSPCGKKCYGGNQNIRIAEMRDVLEFFDRNISGGYYDGELEFLLKHCKSKHKVFFLFKK
jgi:hypothetical protein